MGCRGYRRRCCRPRRTAQERYPPAARAAPRPFLVFGRRAAARPVASQDTGPAVVGGAPPLRAAAARVSTRAIWACAVRKGPRSPLPSRLPCAPLLSIALLPPSLRCVLLPPAGCRPWSCAMGTPARPRRRCHVRSPTTAAVVAAAAVAVAAGAAVALSLAAAAPMMDPAPSAPTGVVTRALPSGAPPTGVRSVRKPAPASISAAVAAAMSAAAAREATTTGTAAAARQPPQPPQPPPPQPAAPPLPLPPPPLLPPPPPPSPPSTSPPPLPLLRPAEPLAGANTRAAALAHARRGWAEVVAARAACALAERRHHVPSYEVNGGEGQEQAVRCFFAFVYAAKTDRGGTGKGLSGGRLRRLRYVDTWAAWRLASFYVF